MSNRVKELNPTFYRRGGRSWSEDPGRGGDLFIGGEADPHLTGSLALRWRCLRPLSSRLWWRQVQASGGERWGMVTNGDSCGDLAPTLCMGEIIVASCHTNNRWQLTYSICILILWPVTNNFFIMHIGSHYELPHLRIFWYLKYNGRQGTKTLICCLSAVAKITICLLFADTTP